MGHHQHADEADEQRRPAVDADFLLQNHDRQQGREQWRREAERRRRAQRQHADREEPAQHRAELRQPALQMLAVALRPPDAPPGARQYDRHDGQECEQGAPERNLAERIGGKLPFHDRIAAGEHHGRADHVSNPERDLVAARGRFGGGHRFFGVASAAGRAASSEPASFLSSSRACRNPAITFRAIGVEF